MDPRDLQPIADYDLNDMEAKAFGVALLWNDLVRKECPDYRTGRMAMKGNPRKSSLFKYAYKLVNETKGILPENQYRLYVLAQIRTLKQRTDGQVHALIDPCALVGPKAWKRWANWKEEFDALSEKRAVKKQAAAQIPSPSFVKQELKATKDFFMGHFKGTLTAAQVKYLVKSHFIQRWIAQKKVTPFYAILSPLVAQGLEGRPLDDLGFETDIYLPAVTDDVRSYFKELFPHEFNKE